MTSQPSVHTWHPGSHFLGEVLNLGADWRLTDANGAIRPDARYNIRTDDGTNIFVQTIGLPPGKDGRTMLRGQFETATNGPYAWMNDIAAVGVLTRNGTRSVSIDMWQVSLKRSSKNRFTFSVEQFVNLFSSSTGHPSCSVTVTA